ncbi:MAG: hypothetical protein J0M15_09975 [Deltaproteobacteria bacterium]|nr:hypothetical protein [Deltaproteobacteria bacterium]
MNDNSNFPFSNVIPIRKSDSFGVYVGEVTSSGEIIEGESVGIAFLKQGSKKFRLKLFLFPSHQYFVVPDEKDDTKYIVLSLEEYQLPSGENRTSWNRIGEGRLVGSFIALRVQLLPENIFLCLFPDKGEAKEDSIAI